MEFITHRGKWYVAAVGLIAVLTGCGGEGVYVHVPPLASFRQVPAPAIMQPVKLSRNDFMLDTESNQYGRMKPLYDLPWINAGRFDDLLQEYLSGTSLFQAVHRQGYDQQGGTFLTFQPRVGVKQYIRPSVGGTVLTLGTALIYNLLGGSACYRYAECELQVDVHGPSGRLIRSYLSSCRSAERLATDGPDQLGPLVSYAFTKTLEDVAGKISLDNDLLMRALSVDMTAKGVIPVANSATRISVSFPKKIVLRRQRTQITGQVIGVDRPVVLEWQLNGSKAGTVPLKSTSAESVKEFAFHCQLSRGAAKITLTLRDEEGDKAVPAELARTEIAYLCVPEAQEPLPEIRQRWAVVIGISDYAYAGKRFPDLKFADKDAIAFSEFLRSPRSGGFSEDRIKCLLNEQATAKNIREGLFEFLAQAGKDDLVMIFFSGHGLALPGTDNFFMLCHDTEPDKIPSTAFPMWDIHTALSRFIKAERVVVLADACHAGVISSPPGTKGDTGNPVNQYLRQLALAEPGRLILTASEGREESFESEEYGQGHGVFTYFLLQGLNGAADDDRNGLVTAGETVEYVRAKVVEATKDKQHPYPSGLYDRKLPLAVVEVAENQLSPQGSR